MLSTNMSSFAQTCNLLSQYLKEKRSLLVAITPSPSPSPSPRIIEPKQQQQQQQQGTSIVSNPGEMTIFYGGQVMVFNDLPRERAEEIMAVAGKGSTVSTAGLPIARRASLHRFLEKRKDRAAVRAPYQLHCYSGSSKPTAHNGNQPSSNHFDLNL